MQDFDREVMKGLIVHSLSQILPYYTQMAPTESFYGFGLYTNGEGSYLGPTANTEEGLIRVAQRYVSQFGGSFDLHRIALRWSVGDWAYHGCGSEFFAPAQKYLEQGWNADYSTFQIDCNEVYQAGMEALMYARSLPTFPRIGSGREILFGLFTGDQSNEEKVAWAKLLNTNSQSYRFATELEAGFAAFQKLSEE